ncbi:PREDICTED: epithelial discoidin domain-containing receptor 1 [Haliaeetus leucocephalus]|uniref:epithelial discoidin domain-containing receptor 1 n=1 Tax=Haliaeetus leucocephalus TaxID=52644 RepID=UPI00053CE172|nr:PREDICTED: epithelial discoidin domain-containing receptor 1 [Haliaeetus leucocephalus]
MGVFPLPLPLLLLAAGTQASGLQLDGHLDLGRCRFALGMEDGSIPDSRLSASSAWSDSTAARHGRLGRSDGDGAWCPAGPVFPEEEEFLEVDLGRLHVVTLVGTQGRHAGGHGREFARAYRLRYSRDRHRWLRWRDRWGAEVIGGNEDPEGVVLKDLAPPPVARALRVYPRAPRAMSVCLRLELYGCPWEAGLLSYTAPRGQVMALDPAPVVLNDSTYDGYSVGPLQFGGLGQLADGVLGLDDFVRSRERRLWPGYDYVGWRRPPGPRPHVELEFEFEGLRTFHAMQVHCNNMHTRGVSIFGEVECRFKRSLATAWEPTPATHSLAGAVKDPSARSVTVSLGGRQARFIQCHFFFTGEWMLFSEITFVSDAVEEAVGASGWPPAAPADPSAGVMAVPEDSWHGDMATNLTTLAPGEPKPGQPVAKADHSHTSILIGCLVAIILLLLGVIFLILWRQYWKKILGKAQRRPSEDELRVQLSVPGDTIVINNATGVARGPPRYERIPPGQGEYQEPTRPRPSLPPAPPGPAAPLANPAYRLLLATYAQPMGGPALPAFPRRRLRFREKLGEGQFGEGTFTPASDAWAFGVTLWEVLTRCREQPYGRLSDEQVIANAGHHFRAQGRQEYLPCPPGCPAALHGVMLRCWSRDAADRPSFGLLHRLLRDHTVLA